MDDISLYQVEQLTSWRYISWSRSKSSCSRNSIVVNDYWWFSEHSDGMFPVFFNPDDIENLRLRFYQWFDKYLVLVRMDDISSHQIEQFISRRYISWSRSKPSDLEMMLWTSFWLHIPWGSARARGLISGHPCWIQYTKPLHIYNIQNRLHIY